MDCLKCECITEEEEKRFNNKKEAGGSYLQLGFSYTGNSAVDAPPVAQPSVAEVVYVPDTVLAVPDGMPAVSWMLNLILVIS